MNNGYWYSVLYIGNGNVNYWHFISQYNNSYLCYNNKIQTNKLCPRHNVGHKVDFLLWLSSFITQKGLDSQELTSVSEEREVKQFNKSQRVNEWLSLMWWKGWRRSVWSRKRRMKSLSFITDVTRHKYTNGRTINTCAHRQTIHRRSGFGCSVTHEALSTTPDGILTLVLDWWFSLSVCRRIWCRPSARAWRWV